LCFLVFGVAAASLFALSEGDRHVLFGVFMLFCCFEVAAFLAMVVLGSWLFDALRPWAVLGGKPRGGGDDAGHSLPGSSFLSSRGFDVGRMIREKGEAP
jgi:hypothetical protein